MIFNRLNDGTHVIEASSTLSTGQTLNAVTDVCFGGAIIAAGLSAYFVLRRPYEEKWLPLNCNSAPWVAPGAMQGGGATVAGSF